MLSGWDDEGQWSAAKTVIGTSTSLIISHPQMQSDKENPPEVPRTSSLHNVPKDKHQPNSKELAKLLRQSFRHSRSHPRAHRVTSRLHKTSSQGSNQDTGEKRRKKSLRKSTGAGEKRREFKFRSLSIFNQIRGKTGSALISASKSTGDIMFSKIKRDGRKHDKTDGANVWLESARKIVRSQTSTDFGYDEDWAVDNSWSSQAERQVFDSGWEDSSKKMSKNGPHMAASFSATELPHVDWPTTRSSPVTSKESSAPGTSTSNEMGGRSLNKKIPAAASNRTGRSSSATDSADVFTETRSDTREALPPSPARRQLTRANTTEIPLQSSASGKAGVQVLPKIFLRSTMSCGAVNVGSLAERTSKAGSAISFTPKKNGSKDAANVAASSPSNKPNQLSNGHSSSVGVAEHRDEDLASDDEDALFGSKSGWDPPTALASEQEEFGGAETGMRKKESAERSGKSKEWDGWGSDTDGEDETTLPKSFSADMLDGVGCNFQWNSPEAPAWGESQRRVSLPSSPIQARALVPAIQPRSSSAGSPSLPSANASSQSTVPAGSQPKSGQALPTRGGATAGKQGITPSSSDISCLSPTLTPVSRLRASASAALFMKASANSAMMKAASRGPRSGRHTPQGSPATPTTSQSTIAATVSSPSIAIRAVASPKTSAGSNGSRTASTTKTSAGKLKGLFVKNKLKVEEQYESDADDHPAANASAWGDGDVSAAGALGDDIIHNRMEASNMNTGVPSRPRRATTDWGGWGSDSDDEAAVMTKNTKSASIPNRCMTPPTTRATPASKPAAPASKPAAPASKPAAPASKPATPASKPAVSTPARVDIASTRGASVPTQGATVSVPSRATKGAAVNSGFSMGSADMPAAAPPSDASKAQDGKRGGLFGKQKPKAEEDEFESDDDDHLGGATAAWGGIDVGDTGMSGENTADGAVEAAPVNRSASPKPKGPADWDGWGSDSGDEGVVIAKKGMPSASQMGGGSFVYDVSW